MTTAHFRSGVQPDDREAVRNIVASTGFFSAAEIDIAVELIDERLQKGRASGYEFVFAELDGLPAGYACYGPIACTVASFDLYWIAVHPTAQHRGLGRQLIEQAEQSIRSAGGRQVYIDTSGRPQYAPTRDFYMRCGYRVAAVLENFYAPGDDKEIFTKTLV